MAESSTSWIFVGSYSEPDQSGMHVVALDGSGRAAARRGYPGVHNPSFLVAHPDGRHLYTVSEVGGRRGAVHAFDIDWSPMGPELVMRGHRSTGGDSPCNLAIDRDGRWLAVTNYGSGEVVVFPILGDGGLGERASSVRHFGSGPNPQRQEAPHPHSSAFDPSGGFLVVADLGTDELIVYALDGGSGGLARHEVVRMPPGAGPRLVRFSFHGDLLCVVNELDNTLSLAAWDPSQGTLDIVRTVSTVAIGFTAHNVAAGIAFDGSSIFVSNRGEDTVARFDLSIDGDLTPVGRVPSGGAWPRAIETVPDGGTLIVANEQSDSVVLLPTVDDGPAVARVSIPRPTAIVVARSPG